MANRQYLCIDLKSFYASVECVERGLDPLCTNLVVADPERSDKTICLAVSPSMKALGVKNRCRIFEIPRGIDYITAVPQMQKYIDYAAEIYAVYLSYVSKDDIHVYSIDEAFLDVTHYLWLYGLSARELALRIMDDIYKKVGVRATCGIGTNLYLCKVALDITAKHSPDFIGELDEQGFKKLMWDHTPLTDFWRIGSGIARALERMGIFTMRDIASCNEELLYKRFGVDAELLIDHAYGRESTLLEDIKSYKPQTNCLTSGQVLMRDYTFAEGEIIVKEMTELMCLDLVKGNLLTDSVTLTVGYSNALSLPFAHGTAKITPESNSDLLLIPAVAALYRRIVNPEYPVRRMNICFNRVRHDNGIRQLSLLADDGALTRNHRLQQTVVDLKERFGRDAILRGMNFESAATTRERNHQIGGHKSGT